MANKIVIALLLIFFAHNVSGQTKTDLQWIQEVEKNKKAESNLISNAYTDEHTQLRHIYYFILHNGRKIVPEVNSIHIRLKDNNLVQHHNNYSLQSILSSQKQSVCRKIHRIKAQRKIEFQN